MSRPDCASKGVGGHVTVEARGVPDGTAGARVRASVARAPHCTPSVRSVPQFRGNYAGEAVAFPNILFRVRKDDIAALIRLYRVCREKSTFSSGK